jgi:hypothetical protein
MNSSGGFDSVCDGMEDLEVVSQGGSPLVPQAGGPLPLCLVPMGGPPGSPLPGPSAPPPPRSESEFDGPEVPKTPGRDGNEWDVTDLLLLSPGDEDYESLLEMRHCEADTSEHWSVKDGVLGFSFLGEYSFIQPSELPAVAVEEGSGISSLQRRRQLGRRVEVAEPPPSCVELEGSGFQPLIHSTPRPSVFEEDDDKTMIGEDSGDKVSHAPEPTPPVLPIPSPQPSSSPATSSSPFFTPQDYGRVSEANPIPVVEAPLRRKAKKLSGKATRRETFIQM